MRRALSAGLDTAAIACFVVGLAVGGAVAAGGWRLAEGLSLAADRARGRR